MQASLGVIAILLLFVPFLEQLINVVINELVDEHNRVHLLPIEFQMLLPGEETHLEVEELLPLLIYFVGVAEPEIQLFFLNASVLVREHRRVRILLGLAHELDLHIGDAFQALLRRLDNQIVRFLQLGRVLALSILDVLVLRLVNLVVLQHYLMLSFLLRIEYADRSQELLLKVGTAKFVQLELGLEGEVGARLLGYHLVYYLDHGVVEAEGDRVVVAGEQFRDEDFLALLDVEDEFLFY